MASVHGLRRHQLLCSGAALNASQAPIWVCHSRSNRSRSFPTWCESATVELALFPRTATRMFNSPRPVVHGRYQNNPGANGLSASSNYVEDNPLAPSVYDSLDPWSGAPTPSPQPVPSGFANILGMNVQLLCYFESR